MFFIMGINSKQKQFNYDKMFICNRCGKYGRYEVFMTYMCFSLFFIPMIKWGKKYFVKTTCCGTLYALDPEIGKSVVRGNDVEIKPEHLMKVQGQVYEAKRHCDQCGYETMEDFEFCPKCGKEF